MTPDGSAPETIRASRLAAGKFRDPALTAKGEPRAHVALQTLETLWFNTGTLCNIACTGCYIESSPRNDRLVYLTAAEVRNYLDEIATTGLAVQEIGFTGGEPFMNGEFPAMLEETLERGFEVLVLTNAMQPMWNRRAQLLELHRRFGKKLRIRVSVDHYTQAGHEHLRGPNTFAITLRGLGWLAEHGFDLAIAGRTVYGETEAETRAGFRKLLAPLGIRLDTADPARLVLFPEMDETADVPEITTACWDILGVSPTSVMCATSRMVVKRKGAERPVVLACTLIPYDQRFEMGETLAQASGEVALNHPHCARFCVLGGASCQAR